MSAVSEFQTAGAEERKARSAKLVLLHECGGLASWSCDYRPVKQNAKYHRVICLRKSFECPNVGVIDALCSDG